MSQDVVIQIEESHAIAVHVDLEVPPDASGSGSNVAPTVVVARPRQCMRFPLMMAM